VGDREIGGKSFAMINVDNAGDAVLLWNSCQRLEVGKTGLSD
jgi:hypothetical protein